MRHYLTILVLLASCLSCQEHDPACGDALARLVSVENRIAEIKIPAPVFCPDPPRPTVCNNNDAALTTALQRAVAAERQVEDLRAQARHAVETWKDPHGTFEDAVNEFEAIGRAD